jgi:hypothetical protein
VVVVVVPLCPLFLCAVCPCRTLGRWEREVQGLLQCKCCTHSQHVPQRLVRDVRCARRASGRYRNYLLLSTIVQLLRLARHFAPARQGGQGRRCALKNKSFWAALSHSSLCRHGTAPCSGGVFHSEYECRCQPGNRLCNGRVRRWDWYVLVFPSWESWGVWGHWGVRCFVSLATAL